MHEGGVMVCDHVRMNVSACRLLHMYHAHTTLRSPQCVCVVCRLLHMYHARTALRDQRNPQ